MRTRRWPAVVLLVLVAAIGLAAQNAQELYQRALVLEHGRGELQQAIELYAQVVRAASGDRALAAGALLRMAASHEKLGADAEAGKVYAELLRTYPEQRAAAARAQERLRALRGAVSAGSADRTPRPVERAPEAELARRLAALVWNGAPDAPLLAAARRGDFDDPAALERQIVRMLRDARSAGLVETFFAGWLSLDRVKNARPDTSLNPHVDAELLQSMDTEVRLFLHSQLRDNRDAVELWTAPYTYVNERLARHYGMADVTGSEFRRVAWPDANRAGLLGQAGLLTALSEPGRTSPTRRGAFVLTRFLGSAVPAAPANVPPLPERLAESPGTMRERMMTHNRTPSCAACHAGFDPLGLALENFDATGRWRTTDGGSPIDASGTFMDGTRFNGPAELRAGLLRYRDAYYTALTRRLLAHALNRKGGDGRVYDYEMPAVRAVVNEASRLGFRWSAILSGIAASGPFQARSPAP